ncbi:hypothetical protein ETAA8_55470 [Anatilimnocola aggregata]|uniref:Uncharacterized protein n=1 Tax=Anatilimnocola aggregata TaxID=2528021 RepID=A0A517YJM2_9BACT|nr:hypothetical protein [Anatilimnocola aggregata]QDU30407.1 hypothetical protein ETAA8_55470 [Anatilimnocola aggregata]
MATGLANSTSLPKSAGVRDEHAAERVIHQQLGRAGSYVKWIEAGSQLLTLVIGTLIFFLLAALIDHWIMPLGWFGRWLSLIAYVVASGWFVATRMLPLLLRVVNPAYSARAIEEATPTLKNSLVNFLFLKQDHAGVKQSVLDALEQRAATDISAIEVDTAIDRTPLIRLGYVLCGVMAIAALYKIASPKDPFQTAARVVAPWADLARPSRVIIHEVQPGHTSVYLGSQVEVTAEVQGVSGSDDVRLIYTSADGQVRNREVPMKSVAGGRKFSATLPAPEPGQQGESLKTKAGLQQGVQYHIEAGDAVSSIYEIRVRMAPTIAVERAELTFPAYTRRPLQTQETGEISSLEGTRVTIQARANQPIKRAFLEFDPRTGGAAESIPLSVEGQLARGTFTLQLKPDRVTPWRDTYQVRFANEQGELSEQPVIHKLQVQADLPPEAQILSPRTQRVDVAEDGQLAIEVRGVDPDFALSKLLVAGKTKDQPLFEQSLLLAGDQPSQASGKFVFRPSDQKLKAGTVVTYQAVAVDNRHHPLTGQPQPGRAETADYTIHIVPARKPNGNNGGQGGEQPPANNPAANNDQQPMNHGNQPQPPMPGDQKPDGANQPPNPADSKPMEPKSGDENKKPNKPEDQQPMQGGQQGGESSGQGQQGQAGQGQGNTPQSGQGQNGQGQQGQAGKEPPMPGEQQPPNNSGQSGTGQNDPNSGESGEGDSGSGNSQAAKPNGQQPQNGQGGAPGNPTGQGQNPLNDSGNESGDQGNPGEATGQPGGANARPGAGGGKPEHDGQRFEEVLKHTRDKAKQAGNNQQGGQNAGQPDAGQEPGNQQPGQNKPNETEKGTGKPQPGDQQAGKPEQGGEVTAEELEKLLEQFGKQGGDQQPGEQGANGQQTPAPNQQPNGQGQPMPGQNPQAGQQPMNQQSGAKPGSPQGGENQKTNDGKSGSPQGAPPLGEGQQPTPKTGEQKKPGAGQNGDSGAGEQSKDLTGSGQGQEQNRDTKKEMGSDGKQSEGSETSGPSTSKKQSDSKGGTSGDQSGGGKQGAGQSGGQQGNDSAGGSSAGDEGAGAAKEQGKGETGSKAGQGQQAAGKTGESGKQPGQGSSTRTSEKGNEPGKGDKQGKPSDKGGKEPGGANAGGSEVGKGNPTGGGTAADRAGQGITNRSADAADEANENYTRKATDLVLQQLRNQEHNPDPELAKKLQLTPQELQEFARRWNQLKKDAEADPNKARELDEAFRSLGLRDPKTKRRAGGIVNDKQRDLRDTGGRTQAPSKYRQQFDQFRKTSGQ